MASDLWSEVRAHTESLGGWFRDVRTDLGLFLLDVADPLGIDKPTLSRIERGELVPNRELGEQLTMWVLQRQESADVPHARTTDPLTSHEAAASVTEVTISATREYILKYLNYYRHQDYRQTDWEGLTVAERCTDEAIAEYLDSQGRKSSRSGVSTRRLELQRAGYVEDSGEFGHTKGGRRAIAWRITDKGQEAIA